MNNPPPPSLYSQQMYAIKNKDLKKYPERINDEKKYSWFFAQKE